MKLRLFTLLLVLGLAAGSFRAAQAAPAANSINDNGVITSYTFSASSGAFTPLSGGTPAVPVQADSAVGGPYPLGFDFWYMGERYDKVWASSNGWLSFVQTSNSTPVNDLTTGTVRPLLAPLWDDLDGRAVGSAASYITSGSAPNRIFTFEWLNWEYSWNASQPVISFQVKLYETTGKVEFVYQQEASDIVGTPTASIGINATATGSGNFWSLNDTSASPTASSTTETTTLATRPATGQVYAFTPPTL